MRNQKKDYNQALLYNIGCDSCLEVTGSARTLRSVRRLAAVGDSRSPPAYNIIVGVRPGLFHFFSFIFFLFIFYFLTKFLLLAVILFSILLY